MKYAKRNILATTALLYANGEIHLGHLVEHIQANIWARFQKLRGHNCLFISGEDAHGTPIMISAEQKGIPPEELIAKVKKSHEADLDAFGINFDNYYTTHSEENIKLSREMYLTLRERGDIEVREISQFYDPEKEMFLPDRYVKGTCPHCKTPDQYGDNCEACGATYLPTDLIDPVSRLTGAKPIEKNSQHYFFKLENYNDMLKDWLENGPLQKPVARKLLEWFEIGLAQWDISRDAPYFGIEIPDAPGKYFYVWLDAPIGYMASFKNYCDKTGLDFDKYWSKNSDTELYHFIGKDITYFHILFWPAMLTGSDHRTPTNVFAHGFLTINGTKMSKSRGTFITAKQYLAHLDPEYLRYYYAAKLNDSVEDIDLNFDDFMQRVNADLVGKIINIASRTAGFITKKFDGKLANELDQPEIFQEFVAEGEMIANLMEKRQYSHAIREITALADIANQYIAEKAPWQMAKDDSQLEEVQKVCTTALNLFKVIMTYLAPITPRLAANTQAFLDLPTLDWSTLEQPILDHVIKPFSPMLKRIEKSSIEEILSPEKVT